MISKSKAVTIASAVTLTGSAAVVGDTFDVRNNTTLSLGVTWSKTTATALVLLVEGSMVKGSWSAPFPLALAVDTSATITSGVATASIGALRYTVDTGGSYHLRLDVGGMHQIRVKAHETGTPGGAITITATAVQEG